MITKPMLAAKNAILENITFPVIATPKIDGIRCLVINGKALTRSFKPIPNDFIRNNIEFHCPDGLDGEIFCEGGFNCIQSLVMRKEGKPDFKYLVFDHINNAEEPYSERLLRLSNLILPDFCIKLNPVYVYTIEDLHTVMSQHIENGDEGTMIRTVNSPYKCGRSTLKEGYLIALKEFEDGEATVIGFEELFHNENEKTKDELGNSKRASNLDNMVAGDTLGAFIVRGKDGVEFKLGTGRGLTKDVRKNIWDNRLDYLGKLAHYRYQKHGALNKPRIPVWHGFRDERDMS